MKLTSLRGLTQAEAARQVGISLSGMKSRVQRCRDQLRQMLVRCCEIDVDVRGDVSDFPLRSADACGGDNTEISRPFFSGPVDFARDRREGSRARPRWALR